MDKSSPAIKKILFKKPFHLDMHHKILLQFLFHAKFKAKVSNLCANKVPPNEIAKIMAPEHAPCLTLVKQTDSIAPLLLCLCTQLNSAMFQKRHSARVYALRGNQATNGLQIECVSLSVGVRQKCFEFFSPMNFNNKDRFMKTITLECESHKTLSWCYKGLRNKHKPIC